ncbi:IS1 family transposase [Chryseobacterium sp. APV1]|uniref:IS1 family transposase n=1 Tax=Chryseobacterium urinae TaxID=3058400 RepID=A0ABT8U335_9FLAO|nr:IS1 family transposase [Chryseobacterium sp. APV1]MDO3425475.1 IS1 family transposase [Chryseobacterium sp. APV1]
MTKEGTGIRSTARLLKISPTTLLTRIITIAKKIVQPSIPKGKTYQVDEMRTYVKRKDKLIWIVYALEKQTNKVVSFHVGRRTNQTLKKVITSLELSEAEKNITDKLKNYNYLIRPEIHSTKFRGINHIERKNLTLRTHLKRLNRKTICFSKSLYILNAILKIYFWG